MNFKSIKIIWLVSLFVFIIILCPRLSFAQNKTVDLNSISYPLLEKLPLGNNGELVDTVSPIIYVKGIVQLAIAMAGIFAVLRIIMGGFQYVSAEGFGQKSSAKETIQNSLLGLLLAIGSYSILYTLNDKLVNLDLSIESQPIPTLPGSGAGGGGTSGGGTGGGLPGGGGPLPATGISKYFKVDPSQVSLVGQTSGLNEGISTFGKYVGAVLGEKTVTITSGLRTPEKNEQVGGAKRSDHLTGNAIDIGTTVGARNIEVGRAALVAAGMPPDEAAKLNTFYGMQGGFFIAFNTNADGFNHYNHVHISDRRGTSGGGR